jgi:hypothetical protein
MILNCKKACIVVCVAAALVCAGCKSAPKPAPAAPPAGTAAKTPAGSMPEEYKNLRERALAAKAAALELKADRALKDSFAQTDAVLTQAEAQAAGKKWKDAGALYTRAIDEFDELARQAAEKRRLAEVAYQKANQAILEARGKALEAEAELRAAGVEASAE